MNPPHPPPDNPLAPAPPTANRDQPAASSPLGRGSLRDRIALDNPHLVPMKKCQELAMMEGYKYLGGAAVGTFVVAKLAKVSPNAAVASAAGAGVVIGFVAAALNFQLCSTTLGRDLHAAVYAPGPTLGASSVSGGSETSSFAALQPGSSSAPSTAAADDRRN